MGNGEGEVFAMEAGEARARAAVVEAARSSIGRVEKHWKVEHDVVAEDTKAKNLDFGSSADYYEAKRVQLNNSEQQEQEGEAPEEEPAMAAVDVAVSCVWSRNASVHIRDLASSLRPLWRISRLK